MKLYEIDAAILDCVDIETGEIFDYDKVEALMMERDVKIENLCLWLKNLNAEAEALKAEEKAFKHRREVAENKAKSLKEYIAAYLDGAKFESAKVKVSYRKSESLEISEGAVIPEQFLKYKEPEVDKIELKKALKAGENFKGVSIKINQNIQIK